jgi:large subunit ribosomal protein L3
MENTMIGLLGKKVGMTQLFDEQGRQVPVTVLEIGPCHITSVRTQDKNGYSAVQLAYGAAKEKRVSKPRLGQFKKANTPALRFVREIRTSEIEGLEVGGQLAVNNFEVGDFVDIEGTSIGRGFQGVVKRHHFKGGASKSHGSMFGRVPGSIGASSFPSRVVKGMRAAGHMGNKRITVQNLKVVKVDAEENLLLIKGSVPGFVGQYLIVKTALKRGAKRKWKVQGSQGSVEASSPAPKSE